MAYRYSAHVDSTGQAASLQLDANGNPPVMRATGGGPAPGQTIKGSNSSGGDAGNATRNIYTVSAGKTWFETDISVTTDDAVGRIVQLTANGVVIDEAIVSLSSPWVQNGIDSGGQCGAGLVLALVLPTPTATKKFSWKVTGFEQ